MKIGDTTAHISRARFRAYRQRLLAAVAAEQLSAVDAVRKLVKRYQAMTAVFLRLPSTTYSQWLEHGPHGLLEEIHAARRDDAVWDRLVDLAYQERSWERAA